VGGKDWPRGPYLSGEGFDLDGFRVVLDDTTTVEVVLEPPVTPAQPRSPAPPDSTETQWRHGSLDDGCGGCLPLAGDAGDRV
jgi:hypothetical protein